MIISPFHTIPSLSYFQLYTTFRIKDSWYQYVSMYIYIYIYIYNDHDNNNDFNSIKIVCRDMEEATHPTSWHDLPTRTLCRKSLHSAIVNLKLPLPYHMSSQDCRIARTRRNRDCILHIDPTNCQWHLSYALDLALFIHIHPYSLHFSYLKENNYSCSQRCRRQRSV